MKKKIISNVVATLVCATCVMGVVGLTACGGLSLAKGEELANEEAWIAAFEKTEEAKNVTAKVVGKFSNKMTMEVAGQKATVSTTTNTDSSYYLGDNEVYSKSTSTTKVSGNGESETLNYLAEGYLLVDGETLWDCEYEESPVVENPEWTVSEKDAAELDYYKGRISVFAFSFSTTEGGNAEDLVDLYEAFEYSNGYYTATLYLDTGVMGTVKVDVKVSFKDGYALGYTVNGSVNEETEGVKISGEVNITCVLSNFGSTVVSASSGAKKAIEAAKA